MTESKRAKTVGEVLRPFSIDELLKCRESLIGDARKELDLEITKRSISDDVRRAS